MGGETAKRDHTGRRNDDNNYAPTLPELAAAVASSNLKTEIPFAFWGKEAVKTAVRYNDITFTIFARDYLLVFVHWCWYQKIRGSLGGGYIVPGILWGGRGRKV